MGKNMDELRETTETQLKKILSDEQMDLYREMRDERPMPMDEGMHPPHPPMNPMDLGKH